MLYYIEHWNLFGICNLVLGVYLKFGICDLVLLLPVPPTLKLPGYRQRHHIIELAPLKKKPFPSVRRGVLGFT